MGIGNDENKAKPEGNSDDTAQSTPDVKVEEWSAEEIAEQSPYEDGASVKGQIKQGRKIQKENASQ